MNAEEAQRRREQRRARIFGRGADAVLTGAVSVAIIYLLLILITFKYGRDQGIYAVVGETILSGGAPYSDAWDFKPPFIFFVYAAARVLLGPGMEAIRLLEAAGLASLVVAFAILSRRFLGNWRAGLVGAALAVFLHVKLEFWHTAQPESFGGIITAWALVCATFVSDARLKGADWKQYAAWLGAGALYTTAALLKPPLGGGFIVSLAVVLDQERRRAAPGERLRRLAAVTIAFGLGALAILGGTLLFFWSRGSLGDLYETFFVFAPEYTALGFDSANLPSLLWRAAQQSLTGFSVALPLGLVFFIVLRNREEAELSGALHVLGVVAFQLLGIALQAKFFNYHYGATLPLLSLLAGWGLWKLWKRAFTDPARVAAAAVLIGIVLTLSPVQTVASGKSSIDNLRVRTRMLLGRALPTEVDQLHTAGDVSLGANRAMAGWLVEHTPDDAVVYIWGFEPMVYDMAARRSASRYIYNVPQRLDWPGAQAAREELLAELVRAEPEVILVLRNDVFPFVTGDTKDSWEALHEFSELGRFIGLGYHFEGRIQDFLIYTRRTNSSE